MCVLYVKFMDEFIEGFRLPESVDLCSQSSLNFGLSREQRKRVCVSCVKAI